MSSDDKYNGWTNYETWAVKLWMDNDRGEYEHWKEAAQSAWDDTSDQSPNTFCDHAANARIQLVEALKDSYDENSDHPVFSAADGTVYADLLNAALSEVNWHEIADSLLEDVVDDYEPKAAKSMSRDPWLTFSPRTDAILLVLTTVFLLIGLAYCLKH